MSKQKILKLISIWKKRPQKYKLRSDQVMVEVVINLKGFWHTRHIAVSKNDPILKS